ncbi:MAG: adenylate/guanylate cyclase domain-containing protein [Alphaproteobacteria bacterium]|nr:adenylate/guanylate cyclase domain-containing protein [Alphaproteobacteria bacterium]
MPHSALLRKHALKRVLVTAGILALLLLGLPLAVWLDLRNLSDRVLRQHAEQLNTAITGIRAFYGQNVVGRILGATTPTKVVHNYKDIAGAIPIPATMSIELGEVISSKEGNIQYRFVSDYPFRDRPAHKLDAFERDSLAALRQRPEQVLYRVEGSLFDRQVRLVAPVIMGEACVRCHNVHVESPKKDWKVGDVRGIQEIEIRQPIAANIFAFRYLLGYMAIAAAVGVGFIAVQHRQAVAIGRANQELEETNNFLAAVSMKIAKYLSPQIYKGIFSGQKDVVIATERKKLTIFFSDIKDFTATTERLQPEDLTQLLNEYLTEMSRIALKHGATVDKFIGAAMLVFFGDPETRGVANDAKACLHMAIEMQRSLVELNASWRHRGVEQPFRVRMGISTGFCNVGNFGSNDRMDYTIIGAEANLAARLQSIAEPGEIVLSYETYALVRDIVRAKPLPAIKMKGISREIVPYAIEGLLNQVGQRAAVISEHATGLDLFVDTEVVDDAALERAKQALQDAIGALDARLAARTQPKAAS